MLYDAFLFSCLFILAKFYNKIAGNCVIIYSKLGGFVTESHTLFFFVGQTYDSRTFCTCFGTVQLRAQHHKLTTMKNFMLVLC